MGEEAAVEENCRSGTDDVGSAPLVLLPAAAAAAPDEDTLRLGLVATVGDSGSGRGHGRMLRWEQKAGGSIYCCQAHAPTHAIFVKKNNANNKRQSLRGRGWMLQWKVEVVDIKPLFQPGTYSHPQSFSLHPTYLQNKHLKSRRYLCH